MKSVIISKKCRELRILIVVALITIAITSLSYSLVNLNPIYHIEEFDMDVYVEDRAGFNVDRDAIHFGIMPPTGVGERRIDLVSGPYRTRVTAESYGDIAKWVHVSKNNVVMEPNESTPILVRVMVPEDAKIPDYKDGKLRILFKRIA